MRASSHRRLPPVVTPPLLAALAILAVTVSAQPEEALVIRDFLTSSLINPICRMTLELGVATVAEHRAFAEAGALMSYGPDLPDLFERAADYVERILKGAKPADLPIQLPVKFEFAVNLSTAKRLGITLAPDILFAADLTIER